MNHVAWVPIAGTVGGLLTWVMERGAPGAAPRFHELVDPVFSMGLGAAAAFIFVFVISNTDRTDRARLLAISMLAGFSFEPVLEAGRTHITRRADVRAAQEATAAAERAATLSEQVLEAPAGTQAELLARIEAELEQAAKLASRTDSYEARARVAELAKPVEHALGFVRGAPEGRAEEVQRAAAATYLEAIQLEELPPPASSDAADRTLRDRLSESAAFEVHR